MIDIAGDVAVTNPKIMTDKGAHAGMAIGQVKALYGSAFKVVKKTNYGVTQYFGGSSQKAVDLGSEPACVE